MLLLPKELTSPEVSSSANADVQEGLLVCKQRRAFMDSDLQKICKMDQNTAMCLHTSCFLSWKGCEDAMCRAANWFLKVLAV